MVPWGRKPKFEKFYEPSIIPDATALEVLQDFVIEVRLSERVRLRRGHIGSRKLWTVVIYANGQEFLIDLMGTRLNPEAYDAIENVTHFTLARAYNLAVDQL
jgi:hypothetical protein